MIRVTKTRDYPPELLEKLRNLRAHLGTNIIGQDHVLDEITEMLQAGELGLTDPNRPKASFLFLGPTGVGKTETALVATDYLYGPDHLARIDMSEFQLQESLPVLIGRNRDDQGLIGQRFQEIGGKGTILFDEIEKAHRQVLDLLLQILDAARVTLADGTTLDLSQFYIILTSNLGSRAIANISLSSRATRERFVRMEAERGLRPETVARISKVCVFGAHSRVEQLRIIQRMVSLEVDRLEEHGHHVEIDSNLCKDLLRQDFDKRLGARPLRTLVEGRLRQELLDEWGIGARGS